MRHTPVLLQEVIHGLDLQAGDTFVDCNLGDGGHTQAIIEKFQGNIKAIAFDLDGDAIDRATTNIFDTKIAAEGKFPKENLKIFRRNFKAIGECCNDPETLSLIGKEGIQGILFDLGLSSYELEESGRGFTFRKDEPLSMTFGVSSDHVFTASDIVNNWAEEHIVSIIEGYGEDIFAKRIAKAIVAARGARTENSEPEHPIMTTFQLAEIVKKAVPFYKRNGKIHPATKTFQALRIAVNDELTALEEALPQAFSLLRNGGRLVVISYHSLEDRIVKRYFKTLTEPEEGNPMATSLSKKPIAPSEEEIGKNPRSRSAKLRIIEKI